MLKIKRHLIGLYIRLKKQQQRQRQRDKRSSDNRDDDEGEFLSSAIKLFSLFQPAKIYSDTFC